MSELPPKKPARKPAAKKTTATSGDATTPKPRKARVKGSDTGQKSTPKKRVVTAKKPEKNTNNTTKLKPIVVSVLLFLVLSLAGWGYWGLLRPLELSKDGYKLTIGRGASYYETLNKMSNDGV